MTLTILSGFEPGADDPRLWVHGTDDSALEGQTAPTTTTSGLSPSDARRWIKATDTSFFSKLDLCRSSIFTPDTNVWYVQRDLVIEGTVPVGYSADYLLLDVSGAITGLILHIIRGSATDKYKIEMRTTTGGGGTLIGTTSELTTDTKYHLRIETNGTNWTLWIDGTQEVQGARSERINSKQISLRRPSTSSTVEHYWATGSISMSTSESDRPGSSDAQVHDFEVDTGGSESEAEWGDDGDCEAGSTTAVIGDVALDGSDQVDTTTFWCEHASETGSETVDTVTFTFTSGHTIGGGYGRWVCESNVDAKTVNASGRIFDGTSGTDVGMGNIGTDVWESEHLYFQNNPSGGAWNQSEADGLKIGMKNGGGGDNGANTQCAAAIFTLVGLGNDAPPSVGQPTQHRTQGIPTGSGFRDRPGRWN